MMQLPPELPTLVGHCRDLLAATWYRKKAGSQVLPTTRRSGLSYFSNIFPKLRMLFFRALVVLKIV